MHMQYDILLRGAPLTGQDVSVPVADWKEARRLLSLLRTYPYPHAEKRKKRIPSVSFLPNPRARGRLMTTPKLIGIPPHAQLSPVRMSCVIWDDCDG